MEAAFRGLFPFSLQQAPFPILEDLLVQLPFRLFLDYLEDEGLPSWQQQPPMVSASYRRGIVRSGTGVQAGHLFTIFPICSYFCIKNDLNMDVWFFPKDN